MGQIIWLPLRRKAEDFYIRKIRRLWPGLNPRTREPEASMLTTRPPKPLWERGNSDLKTYSVYVKFIWHKIKDLHRRHFCYCLTYKQHSYSFYRAVYSLSAVMVIVTVIRLRYTRTFRIVPPTVYRAASLQVYRNKSFIYFENLLACVNLTLYCERECYPHYRSKRSTMLLLLDRRDLKWCYWNGITIIPNLMGIDQCCFKFTRKFMHLLKKLTQIKALKCVFLNLFIPNLVQIGHFV
jgi:hypothetical protein